MDNFYNSKENGAATSLIGQSPHQCSVAIRHLYGGESYRGTNLLAFI